MFTRFWQQRGEPTSDTNIDSYNDDDSGDSRIVAPKMNRDELSRVRYDMRMREADVKRARQREEGARIARDTRLIPGSHGSERELTHLPPMRRDLRDKLARHALASKRAARSRSRGVESGQRDHLILRTDAHNAARLPGELEPGSFNDQAEYVDEDRDSDSDEDEDSSLVDNDGLTHGGRGKPTRSSQKSDHVTLALGTVSVLLVGALVMLRM